MSRLGTVSYEVLHPFPAEAYLTPQGDVRQPRGAQAYIEQIRQKDIPVIKTEDDVFNALSTEYRAAKYADGKHESVLEHTFHLHQMVLEDASERSDISDEEADMYPQVHDWDEAIGGDTVITDPASEATRFLRGAANATLLYAALGPDNPFMKYYLKYRWSEHTGIWLPGPALTKANDKVAAYDFQLRDDVRATLHRERQESFQDITETAMPKVTIDQQSAFKRMVWTLVELGYNWEPWGCKKLEGDPFTIVEYYAHHAIAKHNARVANLNNANSAKAEVHAIELDAEFDKAPPQRILEPHEVRKYGRNVILLGSKRKNRGPFPPTPNTAAGFAC